MPISDFELRIDRAERAKPEIRNRPSIGGQGRIRTSEGVSQLISSQLRFLPLPSAMGFVGWTLSSSGLDASRQVSTPSPAGAWLGVTTFQRLRRIWEVITCGFLRRAAIIASIWKGRSFLLRFAGIAMARITGIEVLDRTGDCQVAFLLVVEGTLLRQT
ncbi:MAG: hypothetical protein ACUVR4_13245 [Anaerolineae bacterium]